MNHFNFTAAIQTTDAICETNRSLRHTESAQDAILMEPIPITPLKSRTSDKTPSKFEYIQRTLKLKFREIWNATD